MSEELKACCACCRVRPRYIEDRPGRVVRELWECDSCGMEFAKATSITARVAELERRNAELVDQIDQCMSGDGACRASALTTAELQAARLRAEGGKQ